MQETDIQCLTHQSLCDSYTQIWPRPPLWGFCHRSWPGPWGGVLQHTCAGLGNLCAHAYAPAIWDLDTCCICVHVPESPLHMCRCAAGLDQFFFGLAAHQRRLGGFYARAQVATIWDLDTRCICVHVPESPYTCADAPWV